MNRRCWGEKKGEMGKKKKGKRGLGIYKERGKTGEGESSCRSPVPREGAAPFSRRSCTLQKTGAKSHPQEPAPHTYILVDTSQSLARATEQATCISASLNSNPVGLLTRTYFSLLW